MMHKRALAMAAVTMIAGATITIGSVGPASGDDGKHEVNWVSTSAVSLVNFPQAFIADVSRCHFTATGEVEAPCSVPVTSSAGFDVTFSGDVTGTSPSDENTVLSVGVAFNPATLDFPFVNYQSYHVTVAGCGTGSVMLRFDGNLNTPASTWQIVAHSGRGDLTGISGKGTATNTLDATGTRGQASGRIRCGKHHDD